MALRGVIARIGGLVITFLSGPAPVKLVALVGIASATSALPQYRDPGTLTPCGDRIWLVGEAGLTAERGR